MLTVGEHPLRNTRRGRELKRYYLVLRLNLCFGFVCASPSFQRATRLTGTRPEYRTCRVRVKQFRSSGFAATSASSANSAVFLGGYDRRDRPQGTLLPVYGEPEYYDSSAAPVKRRSATFSPDPRSRPKGWTPGRGDGYAVSTRKRANRAAPTETTKVSPAAASSSPPSTTTPSFFTARWRTSRSAAPLEGAKPAITSTSRHL